MKLLTRWRQRRLRKRIHHLVREELKLEAQYQELAERLVPAKEMPSYYLDRLIDLRGRVVQVKHDIDTLKTQLKEFHEL